MDPELFEQVVQEVIRRLKAEMAPQETPEALPPPRKVVVEADVRDAVKRGDRVIRAHPMAVITPLARDAMREKGVRLEVVG